MEEDALTGVTLAEVYDGGRWELPEGVVLSTTYLRGYHWFNWSVTVHGEEVAGGLNCEEPGYVIHRARRAVREARAARLKREREAQE